MGPLNALWLEYAHMPTTASETGIWLEQASKGVVGACAGELRDSPKCNARTILHLPCCYAALEPPHRGHAKALSWPESRRVLGGKFLPQKILHRRAERRTRDGMPYKHSTTSEPLS